MKRKLKMDLYSDCFLPNQDIFSSLYKGKDFEKNIFNLILDCSDISKYYNKEFFVIDESKMTDKQKMSHKTIETNTSGPILLGLIQFLILTNKSKSVLELGSFIGISTSIIGSIKTRVTSIELNKEFVSIAKKNSKATILNDYVIGSMEDLVKIKKKFDFIFADAGKEDYYRYMHYFDKLIAKRGIILFDDIFFHGDVINDPPQTFKGIGVRNFLNNIKIDNKYYKLVLPIGNGVLLMIRKDK